MDIDALGAYISDLLEKIYYLADASQKKCLVLGNIENTISRCKHTLKLCSRIQQNCVYFERDLIQEGFKYNVVLKNEESDSSGCFSVISHDNSIQNIETNKKPDSTADAVQNKNPDIITVSLTFGEIVETMNILQVNGMDISNFWLDIKKFIESYMHSKSRNNEEEVNKSVSTQTEAALRDVSDSEDPVLRQIREIFGSDSEVDHSKPDEERSGIVNNSSEEPFKKLPKVPLAVEQFSKNPQIIKFSGDSSRKHESIASQMERPIKEGGSQKPEKETLGKTIMDKLDQQTNSERDKKVTVENIEVKTSKQKDPPQSTNHEKPNETVENKETDEDKSKRNEAQGTSELEITASLRQDFGSILNEDFYDSEKSPPHSHKVNSSENLNSCGSSQSVDGILAAVEVAQATDPALIEGTRNTVSDISRGELSSRESSTVSTSKKVEDSVIQNVEATQIPTSTNIEENKESEDLEESEVLTSNNIGEQVAEVETTVKTTARIMENENKASESLAGTAVKDPKNIPNEDTGEPEASQTIISINIQEEAEGTQISSSRNIDKEDAEDPEASQTISVNVEEAEGTQITSSRNIAKEDAEDSEASQTISKNVEEEAKGTLLTSRNSGQEDADAEPSPATIYVNIKEKAEGTQITSSREDAGDLEATQTIISTNIEKESEITQLSTSRNTEDTEDPEATQTIICTNIEKETEGTQLTTSINTGEPEETQTSISSITEEEDIAVSNTTQTIIASNIDKAAEGTELTTSRNVEDTGDGEVTQTTISAATEEEGIVSENLEATQIIHSGKIEEDLESLEATQISTTDIQSTVDSSTSETSVKKIEDADSPRKKEFLSILGLAKYDFEDKSKTVSDSHFSANDEVMGALKYLQELDTSSECGSVISVRTDSLFTSDSDDSMNLTTDFSNTNQITSRRRSKRLMRSRTEHKIVNDLCERRPSSKKVKKRKKPIANFVHKDCSVKIQRVSLDNLEKKATLSEENEKKKFGIKDCYVKLEYPRVLRVSSDSEDDVNSSSNEDGEIDRLCDLSTLNRKRKERDESANAEKKKNRDLNRIKRKRRNVNLSGTDTSDLTGFSSVSDDEIGYQRGGIFDEELELETKTSTVVDPNELLTEIVCHTIHASGSSSSDSDSNEEVKSRAKSRKNSTSTKVKSDVTKKESWRDDPLLTGKLDLPSDGIKRENREKHKRRRSIVNSSDSDCADKTKRIRKHKKLDPSWRSDDDSSSTNSSGDDFETKNYIKSFCKSKTKGMQSDDSDIELVDNTGSPLKSSVISLDSDEDHDRKPGRRNILSVLSSAELTQETQKAAKEEEDRVNKLQMRNHLRPSQSQVSTEDCLILDTSSEGYDLTVDPALSKRLFPHQVDGVKFMWDACYLSLDSLETFEGTGCILAHNMGLGKTFQVVTLVHTLFSHSITNTKHVLIVCPLSTVSGWCKEFNSGLKIAANKMQINIINIKSSDDWDSKFSKINKWQNRGGVLIVGYEAFVKLTSLKKKNTMRSELLRKALVRPGPDLVVCDEGHLLKNGKTLRTKSLMDLRTKRRIALTGTPLQNNLLEYYFMVQFVKPNLLGTRHEFSRQFGNPILNGQYEDSDEADITLMKKRTHVLHRILKNTVQRYEATELEKYIENMKDYALFIQLHPVQEELYRYYIEMAKARKVSKCVKVFKNFFNDYQLTKFICSHPQLLYTMETQNAQRKKKIIKEKDTISEEPEVQEVEGIPEGWWKSKCCEEVKTSIEFGTKLQVMMGIIEEAEKIGEKVLIFTSSLVELGSIEYFLKLKGTPSCPSWRPRNDYFRMDGTVPPSVRTQMCDIFNDKNNKRLRVFLMSHKVGGLGLNLVAANRVILLGANFNPSHDSQSIFRAYRFGQQKCVYIYRLLSMGTMEEKIYHRCVTKLAIASRVIDKHQIARHYKNLDLEDLYTVSVDLSQERSIPSKPEDNLLSNLLLKFDCIHKYHQHQKLLENRPDEDLNEEDKMKAWEEFKSINVPPNKNSTNTAPAPNKMSSSNLSHTVTDIISNRWMQLNQAGPSRVDGAVNPLARLGESELAAIDNFLFSGGNHFMLNNDSTAESQRNLVPNPAVLNKNFETINPDVRKSASSSSDILQNRLNNPGIGKTFENKKHSTSMGPNPFVINKITNKKENLPVKVGIMPWRKTSSDDFQKPTGSKVLKSTSSLQKSVKTKLRQVNQLKLSVNSRTVSSKGSTGNSNLPSSSFVDDDDDVIVIDSPEKKSSAIDKNIANKRSGMSVKDALDQLSKNKISVSYGNKKTKNKKDSLDDTFSKRKFRRTGKEAPVHSVTVKIR